MLTKLVVIPCYNEQSRLEAQPFLDGISSYGFHLLFVNDGSKDGTLLELNSIARKNPDFIRVLNLEKNQGKAEAVRAGMNEAVNWKSFDIVGYADADLATPFVELDRLVGLVNKEHSFVFGSRIVRLGSNIERNAFRYLFGRISATFASMTLGLPVYDTQCGAKFFESSLIPAIFNKPFLSRWLFDVELFFRMMNHFGKQQAIDKMYEVPLDCWIEMGESKLKFTDVLKVPLELLRIRNHYRRNAKG